MRLLILTITLALAVLPALASDATEVHLPPETAESNKDGAAKSKTTDIASVALAGLDADTASTAGAIQPGGLPELERLTLEQAVVKALRAHPAVAALEKEYWALDSAAWQEGRRPNPEIELEFEEFGGTGDAKGIRALATSLTYTQPLERGGKRSKRETAMALEREIVSWDIAGLEHGLQAQVRGAYSALQAAQYELDTLAKYQLLLGDVHDVIAAEVEAGRKARLELERLDIELARLELEVASAGRMLEQARLELAGTWGATSAEYGAVEPLAGEPPVLPALATLLPLLAGHPEVARFDAEYEALCAAVDLENANAVPDLAVFGGLTRLNEAEETVFKIGVAMDLPLHDKKEGAVSAAGYRLEQVEDNRASALRELETELAALHGQATAARANYLAYGESLLPAAREALELTEEGYSYGKFPLMDVLDAQRTLLELESEQAAALLELHAAQAAIEALLAADIELLAITGQEAETGADVPGEVAGDRPATHEENSNE